MGNQMKTFAKGLLHWCVIVACSGLGVWQLVDAVWRITTRWEGGWLDVFFMLVFPVIVAIPLLAIAYICMRRQYRKLFLVLGVVGAVAVCGLLMALPDWLGIEKYFHDNLQSVDKMRARPWLDMLAGPFYLICLFGPIFAAAWFYRLCRRLAYRGSPGWEEKNGVKTRATRWLVWPGVLCMLSPIAGIAVTFSRMTQSTNAQLPAGSLDGSLYWVVGLFWVGILLIFIGLVRRQPILKRGENGSVSEPV
jgi:hypothetical protein